MENATEALKMAFGIIMFVLALSLSISSFSNATRAVDTIVTLKDRETQYTYVTPSSSNRIVGVETIVPTLYKAYKENFRVQFFNSNGEQLPLYNQTNSFGEVVSDVNGIIKINYIDLENEVIATPAEAIEHLNILLKKKTDTSPNKYANQFIYEDGLYKYLSDKKFEERLGEYYQEDEGIPSGSSTTLDINKTKKRVITYILQ